MIHSALAILRVADSRNCRAVVLVPEVAYRDTLLALGCLYPNNSGRSARMASGNLVTVLTPLAPMKEAGEGPFDLYLSGWGGATPQEERKVAGWAAQASALHREIS